MKARTEILCKGNIWVVCELIKMRIIVNKVILREAAKTEQLVEKVESKESRSESIWKSVFFVISCIILAYLFEQ